MLMKLRTMRTFDEVQSFYGIIGDQYPGYTYPRISAVHYGVFDVGEGVQGWGEGNLLVAGAAIDVGGWDIFEPGGVVLALFQHLIVKPEFRDGGIGAALLNFIVESHCDLTVQGRVSKHDEWERLVPWYQRFGFQITGEGGNELYMERQPDVGGEDVGPELRERAANRQYGKDINGLDLEDFRPGVDLSGD